jgi:hypothetical protein
MLKLRGASDKRAAMKKALLWSVGVVFVAASLYFWFAQEWSDFLRPPWDGAFRYLGAVMAVLYVVGEISGYFAGFSSRKEKSGTSPIEVIHRPIYEEVGERPKRDTLAVKDDGRGDRVAVVVKHEIPGSPEGERRPTDAR